MPRTLYVLATLGLTVALVEVSYCISQWINDDATINLWGGTSDQDLVRILTYFISGLVVAGSGVAVQLLLKQRLLGGAGFIAGFYLMLLGANGGFWSGGHYLLRLILSAGVAGLLCLGIIRLDREMNRRRADG
jgi:hypothetical protein